MAAAAVTASAGGNRSTRRRAAREAEALTSVTWGGRLLYEAQAKQDLLHRCGAPFVLYGGAAGGGKSKAGRWHGHILCLTTPGIRVLFLRKHSVDLQKHHLLEAPYDLPRALAVYNAGHFYVRYHNGSHLQFGHCNSNADFGHYLSTEWDVIIVDEGGELTEYQLTLLATRTGRRLGYIGQLIILTNPGGPGHGYNYRRFIAKDITPEEDPHYDPTKYVFIFADLHDNKYLKPDYIQRIESLPDEYERRRFLGDWELPSGNLFSEIEIVRHRSDDPAPYPDTRRSVSADWGWDGLAPALWWEADAGVYGPVRHRLFQEWYPRETIPPMWAKGVIERSKGLGVTEVILDSGAWAKGQDGGPPVAEQMTPIFQAAGIRLVQATKGPDSVYQGVQLLHTYLWTARGQITPLLTIHDSCRQVWRDLTTIQRGDFAKGQDSDKPAPKQRQLHGVDAVRYYLQSRPAPAQLTLEQRRQVDHLYQRFATDQRSLEAAYQERAMREGLPLIKAQQPKVKQRRHPWQR